MTNAVENILDKFHKDFGTTPKLTQLDDGKEFYNVDVKIFWMTTAFIIFPRYWKGRLASSKGLTEH